MELLEQILAKHQHQSPTHLSKEIRIKKYKPMKSDLLKDI